MIVAYIDTAISYLSGYLLICYRMIGQDVKAQAQFCAECGENTGLDSFKISTDRSEIGYKNPKTPDATEVFCKTHYEQLFASKCNGCNQPIMGQYINANGEYFITGYFSHHKLIPFRSKISSAVFFARYTMCRMLSTCIW